MFAAMGTKFGQTTRALCWALIASAALAGCSGSDGAPGATGATGPQGPTGPTGPTGPAGPVLAFDIATAQSITGTITGVTGTSQPTVAFKLVDQTGRPLKGLQPSTIRFAVAKLVPGASGKSSQWVSYINRNENATPAATTPVASWGTAAQRQATSETATATGVVFTDNGDGTYTYKFAKDLGAYTVANSPGPGPAIAFDGALTHRIGFEIRGTGLNATNNPVYTYVPATGSTTTLPARYDVVNTAECAACHDKLEFHGGPRTDVQYCVVCHNPGTIDAQSANSVDMKVMVHKIHMGEELPSVVAAGNTAPAAGKGYTVWGNGLSYWNFNEIAFTQDVRNCTTCHRESDTSTPQASNWKNVANTEACATCHDDVNFTTGAGHGGIITNDAECLTCHGPNSVLTINGKFIRTADAHVIPELEAAKAFKFEVVRVDTVSGTPACAASVKACVVPPGEIARVTIKVSNPVTGALYKITDAPFTNLMGTTAARLRARVSYTTLNYSNPGANPALTPTAGTPAQPIQIDFLTGATENADGTYTKAATVPMPAGLVGGSGSVFLEGRTIVNVAPAGQPTQMAEIGVTSSDPLYFAITDATVTKRRDIVNVQKCNDCHKSLSFHGDNRNNQTELCATCHNPELTTQQSGVAGLAGGQPFDFKYMIHGIHAGTYKHGRWDFTQVHYPGALENCEGCHKPDTYYPVDPTSKFGTSIQWGTARNTPADDLAITPNVAACVTCHTDAIAKAHMEQNGGVVTPSVIKNAAGQTVAPAETCQVCHGQGASSDVKKMHDVASFTFR
jgi:OmcA/MtrC family decaheme c-type cytochrome